MVSPRIELGTSSVLDWRDNQLHHETSTFSKKYFLSGHFLNMKHTILDKLSSLQSPFLCQCATLAMVYLHFIHIKHSNISFHVPLRRASSIKPCLSQSNKISTINFANSVQNKHFCTNRVHQTDPVKPGFLESFKKKKAEYVVKYGASFILVHELLGISSYLIVYQLLSSHVLEITTFTDWFGWSEGLFFVYFLIYAADLKSKGIDPSSKLITFAMTVVIVKGLDVMGLVPLRWALSFLITPFVARLLGPIIDPWFASARKLLSRKKI